MPFISETMYRNLSHDVSVHLADWPKFKAVSIKDEELIKQMAGIRTVVEKAHSERKELGIAVRQPLNLLTTSYPEPMKGMEKLVEDEVNVRNIEWGKIKSEELAVKLDTKITPELEEEAMVRDVVRKIQEERKNLNLNLTQTVSVSLEKLPKDKKLVQWMTKKAQISKLTEGNFKVTKD